MIWYVMELSLVGVPLGYMMLHYRNTSYPVYYRYGGTVHTLYTIVVETLA